MTQPQPGVTPGPNLTIGAALVPHPTDPQTACVALQLACGPLLATLAPMAPEEAEAIVQAILGQVMAKVAEARRANLGLIIPPQNGNGSAPHPLRPQMGPPGPAGFPGWPGN